MYDLYSRHIVQAEKAVRVTVRLHPVVPLIWTNADPLQADTVQKSKPMAIAFAEDTIAPLVTIPVNAQSMKLQSVLIVTVVYIGQVGQVQALKLFIGSCTARRGN
jgi:hypothetical protein